MLPSDFKRQRECVTDLLRHCIQRPLAAFSFTRMHDSQMSHSLLVAACYQCSNNLSSPLEPLRLTDMMSQGSWTLGDGDTMCCECTFKFTRRGGDDDKSRHFHDPS